MYSRWLSKNTKYSNFVTEIWLAEIPSSDLDCTKLEDYKQIASYSWSSKSNSSRPLIYVPGKPSLIIDDINSLESTQMFKNDEKVAIDENYLNLPKHPIEPIFRSISICANDFDYSKIDFITDRNNLRKLLDFISQKASKPFIIKFQRVKNFIIMIRTEQFTYVKDDSYGKNFEHISTVSDEDYSGYRTIVSYKFGNHNFLTRFEVDCVEKNNMPVNDHNLNQILRFSQYSKLCYVKDGLFEPKTLIELTSKSNTNFPDQKFGQIFFSKTDRLVVGRHREGLLTRIDQFDHEQVIERFKNKQNIQQLMGKLNSLLAKIKILVDEEKILYTLVYDKISKDVIKFYKSENSFSCLPRDLLDIFN